MKTYLTIALTLSICLTSVAQVFDRRGFSIMARLCQGSGCTHFHTTNYTHYPAEVYVKLIEEGDATNFVEKSVAEGTAWMRNNGTRLDPTNVVNNWYCLGVDWGTNTGWYIMSYWPWPELYVDSEHWGESIVAPILGMCDGTYNSNSITKELTFDMPYYALAPTIWSIYPTHSGTNWTGEVSLEQVWSEYNDWMQIRLCPRCNKYVGIYGGLCTVCWELFEENMNYHRPSKGLVIPGLNPKDVQIFSLDQGNSIINYVYARQGSFGDTESDSWNCMTNVNTGTTMTGEVEIPGISNTTWFIYVKCTNTVSATQTNYSIVGSTDVIIPPGSYLYSLPFVDSSLTAFSSFPDGTFLTRIVDGINNVYYYENYDPENNPSGWWEDDTTTPRDPPYILPFEGFWINNSNNQITNTWYGSLYPPQNQSIEFTIPPNTWTLVGSVLPISGAVTNKYWNMPYWNDSEYGWIHLKKWSGSAYTEYRASSDTGWQWKSNTTFYVCAPPSMSLCEGFWIWYSNEGDGETNIWTQHYP